MRPVIGLLPTPRGHMNMSPLLDADVCLNANNQDPGTIWQNAPITRA